MSVCVCVCDTCACVSCSIAVKLAVVAGGTRGQVIAGLTASVLRFAVSYPSISTFSFTAVRHFLIIVQVKFCFSDLIDCHSAVKFKSIIIIFSCTSSNMVAEGIGGQASSAVARRRRATLLV